MICLRPAEGDLRYTTIKFLRLQTYACNLCWIVRKNKNNDTRVCVFRPFCFCQICFQIFRIFRKSGRRDHDLRYTTTSTQTAWRENTTNMCAWPKAILGTQRQNLWDWQHVFNCCVSVFADVPQERFLGPPVFWESSFLIFSCLRISKFAIFICS